MKMIKSARSTGLHLTTAVPMDELALHGVKANLLLVGGEAEVTQALRVLEPMLHQPRLSGQASALALPAGFNGTFILRGAQQLDVNDQQRLLDWLAGTTCPPQVITTCSTPLFPLVQRGAFAAALYYRLNVITVVLRAATALPTVVTETTARRRAARVPLVGANPRSTAIVRHRKARRTAS